MNISSKIKKLRALILDVDGVLTDGTFYQAADGSEIKRFHTHDGMGLKLLQKAGFVIAIISSRKSASVTFRMQELNIQHVFQGISEKIDAYQEIKQSLSLNDEDIAYMGDDLADLPVMQHAGVSIAPANAVPEIKQSAHWITRAIGGQGAVREVCNIILSIKNEQLT